MLEYEGADGVCWQHLEALSLDEGCSGCANEAIELLLSLR